MKASIKILAATSVALAALSGTAMARDDISFGFSFGPPAPVYVAPPPPVYVTPAPGYYEPGYEAPPVYGPAIVYGRGYDAPRYYQRDDDHRRYYGRERHEWEQRRGDGERLDHDHDR